MRPIVRPQLLLAVLLTGLAGAAAYAAGEGSAAPARRDGELQAATNSQASASPQAPANPQDSREDAAAAATAAQAAARREDTLRTIAMRGWIVPREADASNPRARLLLLLPEGPLLTQAVITSDGRP